MKFSWIIFMFIAICEGAKTRWTDSTEPSKIINNLAKTQSKENIAKENHEMPNLETEEESAEDSYDSTLVRTTRRPLMKKIKFTSKPHAVHYIPSITHAQQVNFSKRKNLDDRNQFRHQNKKKNNSNKSVESDSGEDRFKTFTDADELEQTNRKSITDRYSNRRRGHPLATAASEQFKNVAPYTFNSNKLRSKYKSAIAESLKKFKTIRPGIKEKTIDSNIIVTKVNDDVKNSLINDTDINKTSVKEMGNSVNSATVPKKLYEAPNIMATTLSRSESKVSETEKSSAKLYNEKDIPGEGIMQLKQTGNTAAPVVKSNRFDDNKSIIAPENPVQPVDVFEISESFDPETNQKVPIIIVTAKSIPINNITVETFTNRNIVRSEETSNSKIESKTEENTVKAFTNTNIVDSEDTLNSRLKSETEENIMTVSPITNGEEIATTEAIGNHSPLRRKRHINIIEEERAATTSTGFRFSGREIHTDTDVTYKNIHT